ncbi:MAG TPA: hypothetical protein VEZ17_11170 [Chitinophagaceae bacterium]|jgi:hypothetical protein|nr:hypothetical protein [Chitinophagaceae bacterium]
MKTKKQLKTQKVPSIRIDRSLDQYDHVVLFPHKLAKANEMLRTVGLPKVTAIKEFKDAQDGL